MNWKSIQFLVFSTTRVFILFVLLSFVYVNNNIAHAAAAVASSCRIFLRGECRQLARTLRLATVCARGPEGVKPHKHRLDRKVLAWLACCTNGWMGLMYDEWFPSLKALRIIPSIVATRICLLSLSLYRWEPLIPYDLFKWKTHTLFKNYWHFRYEFGFPFPL